MYMSNIFHTEWMMQILWQNNHVPTFLFWQSDSEQNQTIATQL